MGFGPGTDLDILTYSLVVVIIGGLGSVAGTAIGAVIVGLVDTEALGCDPDEGFFLPRPRDPSSVNETGPVGMAGAVVRVYDSKRGFGAGLFPGTFGPRC